MGGQIVEQIDKQKKKTRRADYKNCIYVRIIAGRVVERSIEVDESARHTLTGCSTVYR